MIHYTIELYLILGLSWAIIDTINFFGYLFYKKIDTSANKETQEANRKTVAELRDSLSILPPIIASIVLTFGTVLMFGTSIILWPIEAIAYFNEHI
jgi:hypothetical protein